MIKVRLVRLLAHARKYIVYQVVWQWISLLCQIAIVLCVAALVSHAASGDLATADAAWLAGIVAGAALRFVCDRKAAKASFAASVDVKRILRGRIYGKLLRLGASYRQSVATSEVVQMAGEGVEQLETYFGRYLPQFFYAMLAPLTLFGALSFVNLPSALVLLLCVPLIPASIAAVQAVARRLLSHYWDAYAGLGDSFLENLQGMTTLKIYRADGEHARRMDADAEHFRRITMKVLTMQLNSTTVMDIVAYGGAAVGIITALTQFYAGNVGLFGVVMIVLLASEFFIPMRVLGSFFHIAMNGMAASDRIFALIDAPEGKKGDIEVPCDGIDIVLRGLRFSYAEGHEVLRGVDLDVPQGSFVSLVGASGCGKSTIAGVLMGRNGGYEGSVQVGGVELSDASEESLMRAITTLPHNSYVFKGTIAENLRMAAPDATDERLWGVLEETRLADFVRMQGGLSFELEEQGSNLSGGQRQRLAFARALLHDSPAYILDEATSNIDVESEEAVMRVVHRLTRERGKTVVLISHRLANVVASDRICLLEGGVIRESGTYEELMAADGAFRALFDQQMALERFSTQEVVA